MRGFLGLAWMFAPGCMGPYPFSLPGTTRTDPTSAVECQDDDHDGFIGGGEPGCEEYPPSVLDCDDDEPFVHPMAQEIACTLVDEDCDPSTTDQPDRDEDGVSACADDCDDDDPARSPELPELCWDGVDNDCDQVTDPSCPDYSGTFTLESPVYYACAFDVVNLALEAVDIAFSPPYAEATNATAQQPDRLQGTIESDGTFVLDRSIPGACDEYYRLSGQFLDADTFTAVFEAEFLGSCFGCTNQSFPDLVGHRLGE